MKYTNLSDIQADLLSGSITLTSLVESYLQNIESTKHLNAYVEVYKEEALDRAQNLTNKKLAGESVGKLYGMVVSIKDVLCYEGHEVNAASKILSGFKSIFTATSVQRLLDQDAIIIGRVNCDQFAMGSSNENSFHGPVRNAQDPERVPGGSSGGSAVAVQANTCLVSLGTDTGGSVRQPAAFCGVVGVKPTYGRISRWGLIAYGSSFDQVGVLAHSVEDAALTLEIMAGPDDFDSTASIKPVPSYSQSLNWNGKAKIAYFKSALEHPSLDECIKRESFELLESLKNEGHTIEAVDFDMLDYLIPAYYILTTAEASSNLARFDGVRYGHRSPNAQNLAETYNMSRTEGFNEEVKRRIILGTFVLSSGYYDAYYTKAQKVRRIIQEKTLEILSKYDFIIMPTTPSPAFKIGEKTTDPVEMYLADIYTVQANMAGVPAISIPFATHDTTGMPLGIQLMANTFDEAKMLAFSQYIIKMIDQKSIV